MLNDLFITRDVIGYLQAFVDQHRLEDISLQRKLDFFHKRNYMSYEQWWRLLEDLETLTDSNALGIDIGKCIRAEHVGVLGYLFRTSSTLGEALQCFLRFQALIYAGSHADIVQNGSQSTIIWNPDDGYSVQTSDEILLAAMINIVRDMIGLQDLGLSQIHFTQVLDADRIKACEEYFLCPVYCAQEKLSITLASEALELKVNNADLALHGILGKQAENLLKELPDSDTFLANLRDIVIRSLHQGRADTPYICAQLNISERTLHRKLKSKGRVFREILRDIRKSLVINYLGDPKLTLAETALLLGYSEQSSFTRAFVNWFGLPPKEYFNKHFESR